MGLVSQMLKLLLSRPGAPHARTTPQVLVLSPDEASAVTVLSASAPR